FSRWHIKCINGKEGDVSIDDIARQVGLVPWLKSNVIVVISTGGFTRDARRYASHIMRDTPLFIVLMERKYIEIIKERPYHIIEVFNQTTQEARQIKRKDLEDILD